MVDQDIIRIKNAVFYAYHGVGRDEQNLGGKFEVDVEMRANLFQAIKKDDLKSTIDYEKVYSLIKNTVSEKKFFLIETLANNIALELLNSFTRIESVVVKLRKLQPPVKGVVDYVEVEIARNRL